MGKRALQWIVGSAACLVVCLAVPSAWAADTCLTGAKAEYAECKTTCREALQIGKDGCLNRDHACVEICRAERAECIDATGWEATLDVCADERAAAVANCKALYLPDTAERDQCIDNAQVVAFLCRDQVREDLKPALLACRQAFRTCTGACPPAGPEAPVDPKLCKREGAVAYKACQRACREDYQIAKDACGNRDHDCVEQCREDREACREPIRMALDAAVAACNATRNAAIAACNGDDACIDQAQVVAFQCRDQAKEDARPGVEACRQAFRDCVVGPPGCPIE